MIWCCMLQHCTYMLLVSVSPVQTFHMGKNSHSVVSWLLNGQVGIFWWKKTQKKCLWFVIIILNLRFLFFMWFTVLRLLSVFCNPRILLLQKRPWKSCWELIITYSKSSVRFLITWCYLVNRLKQMRPSQMLCVYLSLRRSWIFCW